LRLNCPPAGFVLHFSKTLKQAATYRKELLEYFIGGKKGELKMLVGQSGVNIE
jgi:hypothetical protein